jgi:hypothetical protein
VTLSQSDVTELLAAIRAGGDLDVIRKGVELVLQALIEAEATEVIGAERYERSDGRRTWRNGSRQRLLATKAGDVELAIPKLRKGSFFPSILERRRRIDRALFAVVMEAYVHGVSTRKVDDLVAALGAASGISKSEVSRICGELDTDMAAFRSRPLGHVEFPYVFCDATYVKGRVRGGDPSEESIHEVGPRTGVVRSRLPLVDQPTVPGCASDLAKPLDDPHEEAPGALQVIEVVDVERGGAGLVTGVRRQARNSGQTVRKCKKQTGCDRGGFLSDPRIGRVSGALKEEAEHKGERKDTNAHHADDAGGIVVLGALIFVPGCVEHDWPDDDASEEEAGDGGDQVTGAGAGPLGVANLHTDVPPTRTRALTSNRRQQD